MALKAKKPEAIEKRLKMFLFGSYKVGKTIAALNFPTAYVFDTEKGAAHDQYKQLMIDNGSVILQTSDVEEVIEEIRSLGTESHNYHTVIVDPITMLEADLIERAEKKYGAGDMRIWSERDRKLKRLLNLLNRLDMNVIVTAHGKIDYGPQMVRLGTTFDAWKKWPYEFDLIIELEKRGEDRVAIVRGSRIGTFVEGETFNWSYNEFLSRYPIVAKTVVPMPLATPEQVETIKRFVDSVKLPDDTVDKWFTKAGVDRFDDMTSETIQKCIEFVKDKLPKGTETATA